MIIKEKAAAVAANMAVTPQKNNIQTKIDVTARTSIIQTKIDITVAA